MIDMETRTASPLTIAATVLAPVTWGTTYLTVTELLPAGRPLLVTTLRVVPAGLALLVAGSFVSRWRPRGVGWIHSALVGLFNFGLFLPLLVVAVYRLPGGVAAAFGGLQPLLVAGLTAIVTHRRPRTVDMLVGAVAAIGVALVVMRPGASVDVVGVLAALGATFSFTLGVVLTKRFPTPTNRLAATGWQLVIGGVALVPLAALVEGAPPTLTGTNLAGFAYLSLVCTAAAFVLWFNGIRRLPAASPPLLGLAAPITGATLGWLVLGQSLSPLQMAGFATAIGAIAYGACLGRSESVADAERRPADAGSPTDTATGQQPALIDQHDCRPPRNSSASSTTSATTSEALAAKLAGLRASL
jgi:probable blue pigment (indigoidine) exporter